MDSPPELVAIAQEKSGANPLKSLKFKGKQGNQRDAMEDKANPALNPSLEPGSRIHKRLLNKAFAVLPRTPLPIFLCSFGSSIVLTTHPSSSATAQGQAQQGQVEGSHPPTQELSPTLTRAKITCTNNTADYQLCASKLINSVAHLPHTIGFF